MIRVKKLNKWYGDIHVLRDLELEVREGEIFGLLGPNGAGKTTLIRVLTGQTAARGYVRVLGIDPVKHPVEVRRVVGIVPEIESVPNYLTVEEYLYFVARLRNLDEVAVKTALKEFELERERKKICRDLSKGTRQRLMLAASLLHSPKLLFLDEPFINLDPIYQRKMRRIIENYVAEGNTVFMATHILEIAKKLCHRVGIMKEGRIVRIIENLDDLENEFMREFAHA